MNISKKSKTRVSVTMTKPYIEGLDGLVDEGLYLARGDAILAAIRLFLRDHGVEPFANSAEP